jgi:hypothetical protein
MQIETEGMGKERMTRLRAYWITSVFSTLVYAFVLFLCLVSVPVGTKREWLLVDLICLMLLAIPLSLRAWEYSRKDDGFHVGCGAQIMGVFVLLEFVFCLVQVVSLFLLIHRLAALGSHLQ